MQPLEAELVAWLARGSERVIDTACAHVFLRPDKALKLKRHDDLGYVDFSTVERRLWALERELAFNAPAAPHIYRAVRRITRESGGALALEGAGPTVDHLLEMARFDETAVLAAQPQAVDAALAELLGRTIAGFHAAAPLRPAGGLTALSWTIGSNAGLLRDIPALDQGRVETMIDLTEAELERQAARLAHRSATGFARRCHGDLHLGNILLENGRPVLFDCIEFSDLLTDLDIQYDLAFLIMDLDFRGRRDAGVVALSAYMDEAARSFPAEIWDGLAALPLMLATRAAVRAHVASHSGDPDLGAAYVEAAIAHLAPAPPVLAAVGGLSGSGKSRFARAVAPGLGAAPGALILRTDEVRKRLAGLAPTAPLGPDGYTADMTARTYDKLFAEAGAALRSGRAVVLDATFLDPALRRRAEALAREAAVPFAPVWLDAPPAVLEARVAGRTGDASDATVAVLHDQLARLRDLPVDWPTVSTEASGDAAAEAWLAARS